MWELAKGGIERELVGEEVGEDSWDEGEGGVAVDGGKAGGEAVVGE